LTHGSGVATRRRTLGRQQPAPGVAEGPELFGDLAAGDAIPAVGVEGHRRRLRERLLGAGPEALADHEMLDGGV